MLSNMIFYKPISIINNWQMCHSKMRSKSYFTSAGSCLWFEQNKTSKFLGHLQKNNWLNKLNDPSTNYMILTKSIEAPVNYKWNTLTKPYLIKQQSWYPFLSMKVQLDNKELYLTFCNIKQPNVDTFYCQKLSDLFGQLRQQTFPVHWACCYHINIFRVSPYITRE